MKSAIASSPKNRPARANPAGRRPSKVQFYFDRALRVGFNVRFEIHPPLQSGSFAGAPEPILSLLPAIVGAVKPTLGEILGHFFLREQISWVASHYPLGTWFQTLLSEHVHSGQNGDV